MGSKESLLTNLPLYYQTMMPHYLNHLGDLKLFYDVPGKLILSAGDMDNDEQEWFFEVGNRYGMAVGPRSRWPDIGNVKICLENDAEGDGKCEAETIIN